MPIQANEHSQSANPATAAASGMERRTEPRLPARGEVVLALDGPIARIINGELLDVSRSGFRAAHSSPLLETGSQIRFRHESASGSAKVCWNRSTGGRWETGFLIVGK